MAEDQIDATIGGESFGEVQEREAEVPEETVETTDVVEEQAPETTQQESQEPQYTEKGTKLDPDPMSAVHQQLANERAKLRQYEQLLSNPQILNQYMKEQFGEAQSPQVEEIPSYKPEDFESLEDVARVVNELQKGMSEKTQTYEQEVKQLKDTLTKLAQTNHQQQVSSRIIQDAETLKNVPELDPKSPDYIEGLEDEIATEFRRLDFDERYGYKGEHSLADLANRFISTARKARNAGSLKAQTVVKDKTRGKVVTSPKVNTEVNTDELSPSDSIALGISKLFK